MRQFRTSPLLGKIMLEARFIAEDLNHLFFTPEHILSVAVKKEFIADFLKKCGANLDFLKFELNNYLMTKIPVVSQENGKLKLFEAPIDSSNVMIICPACEKATRVELKVIDGKKVRVCKKCGEQLDA